MATINLLPWREELKEQRKQQFIVMLAGASILSLFMMFCVHITYSHKISYQVERNARLHHEINQFQRQIKKILAIKKLKSKLTARMTIIQELQANRAQIVHIFDQMVRILPEGVHLSKINRQGNQLSFIGRADSNSNVSTLMRNIDSSTWLENPLLNEIKTDKQLGQANSEFRLQLDMAHPDKVNNAGRRHAKS